MDYAICGGIEGFLGIAMIIWLLKRINVFSA